VDDDLRKRRQDADAEKLFDSPDRMQALAKFEIEWDVKLGGEATRDHRMLLGLVTGMIVKAGAHPRAVIEYMEGVTRMAFPSVYDGPI